jgi:predicted O-methyltransferase YrrM
MEIVSQKIIDYAEKHSVDEPQLLSELRKETWQKIVNPRMLSGHLQGRLLSMISKITKPKNILEIGTYTGYSTLCLAEGLSENGHIYTIDINEELADIQEKYFKKSGYEKKIKPFLGNAIDIIPQLQCDFDLVFIDADKENYSNYLDLVINKLNIGGIILTDNVLWGGKVIEPLIENDLDTLAINAYNKKIKTDRRMETILIPFRDGISLSRKLH